MADAPPPTSLSRRLKLSDAARYAFFALMVGAMSLAWSSIWATAVAVAAAALAALALAAHAGTIRIDDDGVSWRLLRRHTVPWSDIAWVGDHHNAWACRINTLSDYHEYHLGIAGRTGAAAVRTFGATLTQPRPDCCRLAGALREHAGARGIEVVGPNELAERLPADQVGAEPR